MKVFLSLGSNIGDRLIHLNKAALLLSNHTKIDIISKSKVYETSPMENKEQIFFLNQVIEIKTLTKPLELLNIIQKIESKMGRIKNNIRYQPRVIDIDILTFSDIILNQKELVIPHCKIKSRKFILKPWTDIASDYILPNSKKTIKELLDNISHFDDEVREYH
tara:strand:- start:40 stop:528 length:489 start_codon:yes stop_codon:yes gene_type:complete